MPIKELSMISAKSRAWTFIRVLIVLGLLLLVSTHLRRDNEPRLEPIESVGRPVQPNGATPSIKPAQDMAIEVKQWSSALPRVPCMGPRGLNLDEENDDTLRESVVENLCEYITFA